MQFNDTDRQALAALAKSCLIEFSSYADLASKLEAHIESLDEGMCDAESEAESAQLDALGALSCERVELCVENGQRLYVTDGESVHVVMCLRM